jgi:hypothetical protein
MDKSIQELDSELNRAEAEYERTYKLKIAAAMAYGTCAINSPDDKERLNELWEKSRTADLNSAKKYAIVYEIGQRLLKLVFENQSASVYSKVLRVSCSFCHEYFYTYSKTKRYCHFGCVKRGYVKRRKERYIASLQGKSCKCCHKQFTANRINMFYCSKSCKQLAYRKRKSLLITVSPDLGQQ